LAALPRRSEIYLPLIGIALVALWPLSAYALNPLLFPFALVLTVIAVTVVRRPEVGLAVALALIPFLRLQIYAQPANLPLPTEPFRYLVPLIAFGILFYGALAEGLERHAIPGVFWGIVLLIVAAVLSAVHAIDPSVSLPDIFLLITGAALFLAIWNLCRTKEQVLIVITGAMVGLLAASIQGIDQHFAGVFSTQGFISGGQVEGRIQGSFTHPNEYAAVLATLIPLAVVVAFMRQLPSGLRLLAGIAAVAAVPALNYTYSRSVIVVLVAGSLIWLFVSRPRLAIKVAVVIGIAAVLLAPTTLKNRLNPQSTAGDVSLRQDIGDAALAMYSAHPALGVGIKNFQTAYIDRNFTTSAAQQRFLHHELLLAPDAAPSQYLNTLAEQGLVGVAALAVFLLLAVTSMYRVTKSRDPTVRDLCLGFGMGVMTLVLYVTVAIPMQETSVLLMFSLVALGLSANRATSPVQEEATRGLPASRVAWAR
jgi:O-antigen ligase